MDTTTEILDQDARALDPDVLMEAAKVEAGLEDFGDGSFVEALTRLLRAVVAEAGLPGPGVQGLAGIVNRALVNRLRMQADIAAHPEILEEDVSDPIAIIGLPRTGTSKLQRMMSADPAVQSLKLWRMFNIAPFPGAAPGETDPRIAVARTNFEALGELLPEFLAGHPLIAEEVEEDAHILDQSFECLINVHLVRAPSYSSWLVAREHTNAYAYLRRALQYLQWQDGGRKNRPWVLKTPVHIGRIDTLLEFFPNATLVHTHRDPGVAMASFTPLVGMFRAMLGAQGDRAELAEEIVSLYSVETQRNLDYRDREGSGCRIHDVDYDQIRQDPMAVIRDIHALRGRVLTAETETYLRRWDQDNPQHRFGKYSYSLEGSCLTQQRIDDAFGPYIKRFCSSAQG